MPRDGNDREGTGGIGRLLSPGDLRCCIGPFDTGVAGGALFGGGGGGCPPLDPNGGGRLGDGVAGLLRPAILGEGGGGPEWKFPELFTTCPLLAGTPSLGLFWCGGGGGTLFRPTWLPCGGVGGTLFLPMWFPCGGGGGGTMFLATWFTCGCGGGGTLFLATWFTCGCGGGGMLFLAAWFTGCCVGPLLVFTGGHFFPASFEAAGALRGGGGATALLPPPSEHKRQH